MSFSRVNPSNWAVGDKLTSAQMNQLDSDHANALDKTTAGDTLSGEIFMAPSASIVSASPNQIRNTVAGSLTAEAPGAIKTTAPGGIQLGAGPTDFIAFSAPRTRSVAVPVIVPFLAASGWSWASSGGVLVLEGGGISTVQWLTIPSLHNGATFTSLTLSMAVGQSHPALPAVMPTLILTQVNIQTGVTTTILSNSVPFPASGAAWFNSGNIQAVTLNGNFGGAVIDTTQNVYQLQLVDENGANALTGNKYYGFALNYTAIADMRFQ